MASSGVYSSPAISHLDLLNLTDEEFDAVLQLLGTKELEDTARVFQDAIHKLQHEYKRLSHVQYSDEEEDGGSFATSEQKLNKLCVRNRKCLSRLMAVEWEAEKKSESSSELSSEISSDDLTDQQDSDCSENSSECSSCLSHKRDTQTFAELESISEEEVPEGQRPTDLESCRDFVQSLAAQVEAMQEAIRKSKENILEVSDNKKACVRNKHSSKKKLRVGSDVYSDVAEEEPPIPDYVYSLNCSGMEDDGSYETPMKCREKSQNGSTLRNNNHHHHHNHHNHHQSSLNNSLDQSEYEEVLRVPRHHHSRPESSQNYMAVSSMYINTELPMNNLLRTDDNNHKVSQKKTTVDDTAIYEFPPAEDCSEIGEDCGSSLRGSLSSNNHDDIIYKYDGPIVFGSTDTSEVVHIEERDSVKKWDPMSIVQDLYANIQRPHHDHGDSPMLRAGEISMEGYMEKLPMGRRRASFIKKWKKRYFRAKQGNLFYYEDHKAKKSLGYIQLIGGRITEISNKCIEVTDLRGRVLLLRCSSRMEFEDWKVILNAESGAYNTTPKSPSVSTTNSVRKHIAIVDLGGCSVRAGVLSDVDSPQPQIFFPCVVATNTKHKDRVFYGYEALSPEVRAVSKLSSPFRNPSHQEQFKLSMQTVEGLLDMAFTELGIDPIAYQIMVIVPFNLGVKTTEKLVEMVFDRFNAEGVYVQEQSLMALYSYKATSGIVVNIGERIDVVPIVEGYFIQKGVYRLPFGGRHITEHLRRLLTEGGYRFFTEVEMYIARYLKEKACFVAQDYHAELKFCSLDPELCSTYIDVEKYDIPNGSGAIKLDYSRFRSTEGLFHPEVWGKDHPGLHTLVYNAIQACHVDKRKQMCRCIYLCGGTTMLPGLAERLRSELCRMLPKSSPVKVHASPERYHSAYYGATVLANLAAFDNMCITKEEWKQLGPTSLTKWQNA